MVRGQGAFIGNVDASNQLWMRVVRSTVAHATIESVDVRDAERMPGVALVLTGEDLLPFGKIPLRSVGYQRMFPDIEDYGHPVLAANNVLYVGQPVVAVFADDPYRAEDAAEKVLVEYAECPPVLDPVEAAESAVLLHPLGNVPATFVKEYGDVERVFEEAPHIFRSEFRIGRQSGVPMEMRGCLVQPVRGHDELEFWGVVHAHNSRRVLAAVLQMPLSSIHMRPTDFGGNFGVRGGVFPEYVAAAVAARRLRRPVKWLEDRLEHMVSISHAREQVHRIEGAFDAEGRLLGLRDEIWHNHGAYMRQSEPLISDITAGMVAGPYRVPAYSATVHAVMTNKTPLSAYRAPGRFEVTFARERLLDVAAQELGVDPIDMRVLNVLTKTDLPWEPGLDIVFEGFRFDSGDVRNHVEKALAAADFEAWRTEAAELRAAGRLVGTGMGVLMDKAGLGLYETSVVDVDPSGRVRVLTGASSVGQGIETVLSQIVADELCNNPEEIDVLHGDTDQIHDGVGSWSSRSTVLAGGAARDAAQGVIKKALRVGASLLNVRVEELRFDAGRVITVAEPVRSLGLPEIARLWDAPTARRAGDEPGLSVSGVYRDEHMNYPYGITCVQLEIDATTGGHEIRHLFTSAEAGRVINPMTTRGQIIGAAIQGVGGALFEEFQYDAAGQPLTTSFMDYLLPDAPGSPEVDVFVTEDAPTPDNPFGAKGMGEVGLIAMGAAVAGAIDDALGNGVRVTQVPVHPEDIYDLAATARGRGLTDRRSQERDPM
ncbi:xanthine dehydrogenase family protein molybdopterin-binding subunit [Leekyejoonella antrihumi]|uniref:xanthine dehydrogenase family protein molybdopterin-binding subunit n=1 Tax=Leekyejoonella antrihumi TaxID=1660198 RepID=UPI001C956162|nr:xanthine dehydrogenase family protein molybdopterin-binding subunit [Leekyejoonella antrihumi]